MTKNELIVEIAGLDLNYRSVVIPDNTPTALQILKAGGFTHLDQKVVIQILPSGDLEERRPDEVCELSLQKPNRFIIGDADRLFRFVLEDRSIVWPTAIISDSVLRTLGNIDDISTIFIRREDQKDKPIQKGASIDVSQLGTEILYAKTAGWKIKVQGVKVEFEVPEVTVREALVKADFDPEQGWIIILKSASGKRQIDLDQVIDLRDLGIEKLRLTPKEINNGEAMSQSRRDFKLLPVDEKYLTEVGCNWETIVDSGRRWFIYHGYELPESYNEAHIDLAVEVPTNYPGAQLDMFYCCPHLTLRAGRPIAQTQATQQIISKNFQRWSRHRGPSCPWNPTSDNLITHLGLVEESFAREVS